MIDFGTVERQELTSITALNLGTYLRRTGWDYQGKRGRYAHIYTQANDNHKSTVAVPVFEFLDDHAERIHDALEIICRAEKRQPSAVFHDLAKVDNDSVRIAATNGNLHTPLTLSKCADLMQAAHDLMSNSARAAEADRLKRHRAAFRGNISSQVSSYLSSLTFTHNFQRGYRLTMYSPVSVDFDKHEESEGNTYVSPFAREVTQTLSQALAAVSGALRNSRQDEPREHFRYAIRQGVSANLCDALSRLARGVMGVSIDVKWSLLRESSIPSKRVAITYQHADILRSAAYALRRSEPSLDEQINCYVLRLERRPQEFDGRAILTALRDGKNVRLSAHFRDSDYGTVIAGFGSKQMLSLIGDVYQGPSGLELRNPRHLRLLTP